MEALFHIIVPVLAALAVGFERKKVLTLAVLTILPDLDHALIYRALFHNVFFLLLVTAAVYMATRDRETAFLAALFIGSHLLFDIGGGIALFYPVDDHYYSMQFSLVGKAGAVPGLEFSLARSGSAEWMSALHERLLKVDRVWASTEMMMVLALLLAAFCFRPKSQATIVGVSTHNHESRNHHRALRHHPPKRTGGG